MAAMVAALVSAESCADLGRDAADAGLDQASSSGPDAGPDAGQAVSDSGGAADGADGANATDATGAGDVGDSSGVPLSIRVVAANLSSGNKQSWDPGHGQRILQGLGPDVVLLQELRVGDNSVAAVESFVATTLGPDFHIYREPDLGLPNAIASRWPIVEAGTWDDPEATNRELVWARIDIPGDRDLWAVSVHLLTSNATTRAKEAQAIVDHVHAQIPDPDFLVVGGDLNTKHGGEMALGKLAEVVATAKVAADGDGNPNTNADRSHPYDHILPDDDLDAAQVGVTIGGQSFSGGLVFDSRVYTPLEDVSPVQVGDSAALGVQHMAVVRDFVVLVAAP